MTYSVAVYGRSEGVPTVEGALLDAKAARAKLRELARIEDSAMLLMGESLGGAIVVRLAADSAPRGLILQSTFSSLKDVSDHNNWLTEDYLRQLDEFIRRLASEGNQTSN